MSLLEVALKVPSLRYMVFSKMFFFGLINVPHVSAQLPMPSFDNRFPTSLKNDQNILIMWNLHINFKGVRSEVLVLQNPSRISLTPCKLRKISSYLIVNYF